MWKDIQTKTIVTNMANWLQSQLGVSLLAYALESSAGFASSFGFKDAEGDGAPSWPISPLKSLMLCSSSSIRFPISSSAALSRTKHTFVQALMS